MKLNVSDLVISNKQLEFLAMCAEVVTATRAPLPVERANDDDDDGVGDRREQPERVAQVLKGIALGSALAHGRLQVEDYDLAQVLHIALSSGVPRRQRVLRALLDLGGKATSTEIEDVSGMSRPVVLRGIGELKRLGVVTATAYTGNQATHVELVEWVRPLVNAPRLPGHQGGKS